MITKIHLRSLEIKHFRIYDFLLASHSNYSHIWYRFRDTLSCWPRMAHESYLSQTTA